MSPDKRTQNSGQGMKYEADQTYGSSFQFTGNKEAVSL